MRIEERWPVMNFPNRVGCPQRCANEGVNGYFTDATYQFGRNAPVAEINAFVDHNYEIFRRLSNNYRSARMYSFENILPSIQPFLDNDISFVCHLSRMPNLRVTFVECYNISYEQASSFCIRNSSLQACINSLPEGVARGRQIHTEGFGDSFLFSILPHGCLSDKKSCFLFSIGSKKLKIKIKEWKIEGAKGV